MLIEQLKQHAGSVGVPTKEELDTPYTASHGTGPVLPAGVIYSADWRKVADGMAKHARAQVSALAAAGIPVALQSISSEGIFLDADVRPEVRAEVGHLAAVTLGQPVLAIRHAVFHHADFLRNVVVPAGGRLGTVEHEKSVYESTILYTSLERDAVSPSLVEIMRRCAEVWVPCEQNAVALLNSGMPENKVHVIPYPYDPSSSVCKIPAPRGHESVPDGRRFYSIGKWEPRKNHATLLRAFLCAYGPKDRASLTLKVHGWGGWEGYPDVEGALASCAQDERVRAKGWSDDNLRKRVRIIVDKISEDEIVALHAQNNIYVSVSHGEAWGLPEFDAKCAGNSLVHVGFGGSAEYADPRIDLAIPYHMTQIHPAYGWEASRWAECDFEDVVRALQAAQPPARRLHPPDFNGRFSAHAVGELMKDRIMEIASKWPGAKRLLLQAGSYA